MNDLLTFRSLRGELFVQFGPRLDLQSFSPTTQTFSAVLYESIAIRGELSTKTSEFRVVILLGKGREATGVSPGPFSSEGDHESVRSVVRALDESCRLRLPDDFVVRFDAPNADDSGPLQRKNAPSGSATHRELFSATNEFFGARLSSPMSDEKSRTASGLLYESIPFWCGYDERMTIFYLGIQINQAGHVRQFLGRSPSMESDLDSIVESLRVPCPADRPARLCQRRYADDAVLSGCARSRLGARQ